MKLSSPVVLLLCFLQLSLWPEQCGMVPQPLRSIIIFIFNILTFMFFYFQNHIPWDVVAHIRHFPREIDLYKNDEHKETM
ncbi:hypothetical protein P3S59_26130, partial [Enterobacter hormaechei]